MRPRRSQVLPTFFPKPTYIILRGSPHQLLLFHVTPMSQCSKMENTNSLSSSSSKIPQTEGRSGPSTYGQGSLIPRAEDPNLFMGSGCQLPSYEYLISHCPTPAKSLWTWLLAEDEDFSYWGRFSDLEEPHSMKSNRFLSYRQTSDVCLPLAKHTVREAGHHCGQITWGTLRGPSPVTFPQFPNSRTLFISL